MTKSVPICLFVLVALILSACSKEQPSGIPSTSTAPAQTQPAPVPPPAQAMPPASTPEVRVSSEPPPPLNDEIAPFAKTGYPDCDDFMEAYRQCLNRNTAGEARKAAARDLDAAMRSIKGNIAPGVDGLRIANHCKRARALRAKKVSDYGCTL